MVKQSNSFSKYTDIRVGDSILCSIVDRTDCYLSIRTVGVPSEEYERIAETGFECYEDRDKLVGFRLDKHSWHILEEDSDSIVVNILISEDTLGYEEGSFLRLELVSVNEE